ncbi:MAG: hypothetical protein IPF53_19240 [Blastocatellia bacterium]|nr:hypothetical protein [Blastocatellia bacterium]MBK6428212.1 hypothetical protein [Blastocatellia bacterium]
MHLLVMALFAAVVATVMAVIDSERHDVRAKALYGVKVFAAFIFVGLVIGWVMYFIPL